MSLSGKPGTRHNHEPEYRNDDVDEVDEIGEGEGMIL
jgi:hypothetical protein